MPAKWPQKRGTEQEERDAASDAGSAADSTKSHKTTTRSARGSRERFYNKNEAGLCRVLSIKRLCSLGGREDGARRERFQAQLPCWQLLQRLLRGLLGQAGRHRHCHDRRLRREDQVQEVLKCRAQCKGGATRDRRKGLRRRVGPRAPRLVLRGHHRFHHPHRKRVALGTGSPT